METDFQVILFLEDVSKVKLLEGSFNHKLVYEQMIAEISTRFVGIRADEIDNEVLQTLKKIGDFKRRICQ